MMTIEALYEYQPRVLTFIKKRCNNCHDAEDLVQDAFIRSMNHLDKIEPTSAYPWLCTVVLNLWKDALLSKKPLKRGIVDNLMSRDNFFLDEGEDALVKIEEIRKELKIKPWQVKSSLHNIKLKLKENWKL